MITYDNTKHFRIIFRLVGSVLPKCIPVGIVCFLLGLTLALLREGFKGEDGYCEHFFTCTQEKYIENPIALQVAALVTGYLLVVRTNMALSRWMEGISDVQLMLSKWGDAYDALNAFFSGKVATPEQQKEILMFRIRVAHWFSLMSCLCFATLRNHGQLGTLEEVPIKELFDQSPQQRLKSFAVSKLRQSQRMPEGRRPDASKVFSEGVERRTVASRQGATSVYSMERLSRWSGGSASIEYSGTSNKSFAVDTMESTATSRSEPRSVNRLSSLIGSFLNNSIAEPSVDLISDLDLLVLSTPSAEEIELLQQSNDKPNAICLWIIQAIMIMVRNGLLDTPPPIVSRVFQELSNGMLGFNQAHKVAMVPFPFPFAQLVSVLLCLVYFAMPLYIDMFTQNVIITPLVSLLIPVVYCALNAIAVELEEPFGTDHNDVDIEIRHEDFLWLLVDVLRAPKVCPIDEDEVLESDIIRGVIRDCPLIPTEMTTFLEGRGVRKIDVDDPTFSQGTRISAKSVETSGNADG